MAENIKQDFLLIWQKRGSEILKYVLKNWYLLLLAAITGAAIGYFYIRRQRPVYTASISFVLSTDQRGSGGFNNLAAQLGFDAMTGSPDNLFTGDNIVELFRSRKLIGSALQSEIDSVSHKTLLNLIAQKQYAMLYKAAGPFNQNPATYNARQISLYRMIISKVAMSFQVFKKDKKLIVYILSAQSTDPQIAYYVDKLLLNETSKYFIDTKTTVAATGVKLLQHEADSLAGVLNKTFSSTAAMNDRTYNLNPSVTVQRSGSMFNQAKAAAFAAAYTEVMRNLEIAKINLQKETPLYRILDEPELPLFAVGANRRAHLILTSSLALFLMAALLVLERLNKFR